LRRSALTGVAVAALAFAVTAAACSEEVENDEEAVAGVMESGPSEAPSATESTAPATPARPPARPALRPARVARVIDGDTLETADGRRIRLVQIDAPESSGECYGAQATGVLEGLVPTGSRIGLQRDPRLDDVDRYGRLLRYVFKGSRNLNVVLVRRGAAGVWFFDGDRGRYADRLLASARAAQARKRGAWGACRARLDPTAAFQTAPKASRSQPAVGSGCIAGYSPCLPVTGDLDCADVRALGRAPVVVTGDDPYRLDGDDDGYGCE
jgi:endonuclease YncB( thermonuclease family)